MRGGTAGKRRRTSATIAFACVQLSRGGSPFGTFSGRSSASFSSPETAGEGDAADGTTCTAGSPRFDAPCDRELSRHAVLAKHATSAATGARRKNACRA